MTLQTIRTSASALVTSWLVLGLIALIALGGASAIGCGPKPPTYNYAQEPDPRNQELVLGIGDRIKIGVWEHEPLSTDAIIRADGNVTMPLVGALKAAGDTPSSLTAKVKARLVDFVKPPIEVTIAVLDWNSYRFTVSGEVARPGVMTLGYYVTAVEAIAQAGGFTRFAKRNEMMIQRRDSKTGKVRSIPLPFDFLMKRPEMNIVLLPGDSLFVP